MNGVRSTSAESDLFEIVNVACAEPVKENVTGAELIALKGPLAALVAVTTHWPIAVEPTVLFAAVMTQPVPVALKVTTPVPEPPVVVILMAVPTGALSTVLVM